MEDPKFKKTRRESPGVGVPAKGDSSASNASIDPSEGATISDAPVTPQEPTAPAEPPTRVANPDATLVGNLPGASTPTPSRAFSSIYLQPNVLQPGDLIGGRYEILQLLGEGGMGAVYKALDKEVERTIALKLIRPELASNPSILARFKQELLTSHQVTHKNVIRIYDLAEADGVKFITMEFVEGCDLRRILTDNGKLPPERAIEIIRQICVALDAAHSAGVIHRDLKPQNIMQEAKTSRILVMDFGLARTVGSDGMTQTGALLGTIEYMSPEQAMGKTLDQRSDIFAVGLIFYELLTGNTPFRADTAMASLLLRNQERAIPATELDASIPKGLSDIVAKCLERRLELRYQNVQEILSDLDAYQGSRPVMASMVAPSVMIAGKREIPWKWIASGMLVVFLVFGGFVFRDKISNSSGGAARTAVAAPQVSLAILPFRNGSGDAALDWLGPSLADMLSTDVGQSAHLHTISPDRLHQVLADLKITPGTTIEPTMVSRIAEFSNADTVVWGQYAKFGDTIRIDATVRDLKNNRSTPLKIEAASEKEIPGTVDGLAELIRKNLAVSSDVLKELKASSFQPSSKSVPALREYNQGIGFQRDGKNLEAVRHFEAATKEDPNFALAFSKLAQTYSSLGYDGKAEQAAQKALDLSHNLPETEKYLIAAIRAQITKNRPEAIKAYEVLDKASSDNTDVQSALAALYEETGDYNKASKYNQAILKANPKDITATIAVGRLAILSDKPEEALDPLNRALALSVQLDSQEQKANSLHLVGVAYFWMDKRDEALRNYQQELGIWRQLGQKSGVAMSLNEIARIQALSGDNKNALANFQQALDLRREIGDKRGMGDSSLMDFGNFYFDRGDYEQALKLYKEGLQIQRDLRNESLQGSYLNNIGMVYYAKAQYEDALTYYQQSLQLREKANSPVDTATSLTNIADALVRMGQYDQAISQHMRALKLWRSANNSRGAAITGYELGEMFDDQGRFGAALSSMQSAVEAFEVLKDKTPTMVEIKSGYGQSLILAGRGEEAKPYLNDALNVARELKNDAMVSRILLFQGDAAYYLGDTKSAHGLYGQALTAATRSKEPGRILDVKVAFAKIAALEGPAQQAISSLRQLMRQADELGRQYISVECSLSIAEAMIRNHDSTQAQQELERALLRADKIGLKPLSAKAHYLLGNLFRTAGNQAEAQQHYGNAVKLLDGMRQDSDSDKILQRSDFKTMYEDSTRYSQSAK